MLDRLGDGGVVHQNVEAAEGLHGLLDHRETFGVFCDVALHCDRLHAERAAFGGDLLGAFGIAGIIDDNVAALLGQQFHGLAADAFARAGSGDDRGFALHVHALPPWSAPMRGRSIDPQ